MPTTSTSTPRKPLRSPLTHRYIRLRLTGPSSRTLDALTLRKKIQDALVQSFGTSYALTRVDIVWVQQDDDVDADGQEDERRDAVVRVADADVQKIMAAIAAFSPGATTGVGLSLSVLDNSTFLPSLLTQ